MGLSIDRQAVWDGLGATPWDLVVIGGGITGAGVLREAVRAGYRTLLVEQRDFAWGTSSRSSKMVHGGLRYLAAGDVKLTRHSLRERERLLGEAPGLIDRMGYYVPMQDGQRAKRIKYMLGIRAYAAMAGTRDARYVPRAELLAALPGMTDAGVHGACYYTDTVTDDARLVLRVLSDALAAAAARGLVARALNYVRVQDLEVAQGQVGGVRLHDAVTGQDTRITARAVINATGAWADELRRQLTPDRRIRPLRGSHLVFDRSRLAVDDALIGSHPDDGRPVFIYPWEGATVVGTTDLDHPQDLDAEARISAQEVDYLMRFAAATFPQAGLGPDDILSSWAGVRPVIGSQNSRDPSKERRDHAVWRDGNLISISGGKLTTFRLMARDALAAAGDHLPPPAPLPGDDGRVFGRSAQTDPGPLPAPRARFDGRYGAQLAAMFDGTPDAERAAIAGTPYCLAELRWAARSEAVLHLDDLMLRRTRLGNLLPHGGADILPRVAPICASELGWDADRWASEVVRYTAIWRDCYSTPQ
ncbi:MAG: glycerol-3-phosphate dehydrogenase/oxidase [Marinibacterium sp.]|nr:glycerol-3-phosphate dehydrogenase/oxidase [Marinibacterium sp.]